MRAKTILVVATVTLALDPEAALAGSGRGAPCLHALQPQAAGAAYVDVSTEELLNGDAVTTAMQENATSIDERMPDPLPQWRWASRGDWRRRSPTPAGAAVIPL